MSIKLIVGLGNPGAEYAKTRHNAGFWFVEHIAETYHLQLKVTSKFFGLHAELSIGQRRCHLLLPTTFMNRSGQAVAALVRFYKLAPENILVAHDELDFAAGTLKLKSGGGHGGHNGLRDIINNLGGEKQFHRLRIGIGHPGDRQAVLNYVLGCPSITDKLAIMQTLDTVMLQLPTILDGDMATAMNHLNGKQIKHRG